LKLGSNDNSFRAGDQAVHKAGATSGSRFLLPEFLETASRGVLHRGLLVLAQLIGREAAWVGAQYAAIQFDDAGGGPIEEGAIVGDDNGSGHPEQQLLQSFDGFDIEMIGGLMLSKCAARSADRCVNASART
jgi:hypothetical protein